MTAVLAHEIRNALGSIKGYAQWVDEKMEAQDSKKTGLSAVLQGAGRIESLVNELLFFSREETFKLEGVDPVPLVRAVIAPRSSLGRQGRIGERAGTQVGGSGKAAPGCPERRSERGPVDGGRGNPAGFGPREGRWVKLRWKIRGRGFRRWKFRASSLPFIPPRQTAQVWGWPTPRKPWKRWKGRSAWSTGKGKKGAVLTIHLPEQESEEMGKSILIVEDDALFRSFLSTILKEEGHRLEEARDGKEGLAKFMGGDFDLVIADLKMPGLSGMDLLREAKKEKPRSAGSSLPPSGRSMGRSRR